MKYQELNKNYVHKKGDVCLGDNIFIITVAKNTDIWIGRLNKIKIDKNSLFGEGRKIGKFPHSGIICFRKSNTK